MLRLALLAVTVAACTTTDTYETTVEWSTANPPAEAPGAPRVTARIWTPDDRIIDAHGYANNAVISGDAFRSDIEICLQLGNLEAYEPDDLDLCHLTDDCGGTEFVSVTDLQCTTVPSDTDRVTFTF